MIIEITSVWAYDFLELFNIKYWALFCRKDIMNNFFVEPSKDNNFWTNSTSTEHFIILEAETYLYPNSSHTSYPHTSHNQPYPAAASSGRNQRNCTLENIRQEILRENWSQGYFVHTALNTSFALLCSWQFCFKFAFILTQKSAMKSSRQTRHYILQINKFSGRNQIDFLLFGTYWYNLWVSFSIAFFVN